MSVLVYRSENTLELLLTNFLFNALFYLGHRFMHLRFMYRFHKQHHDLHPSIGLTALNFHWIDNVVTTFIPFAICALFITHGARACLSRLLARLPAPMLPFVRSCPASVDLAHRRSLTVMGSGVWIRMRSVHAVDGDGGADRLFRGRPLGCRAALVAAAAAALAGE